MPMTWVSRPPSTNGMYAAIPYLLGSETRNGRPVATRVEFACGCTYEMRAPFLNGVELPPGAHKRRPVSATVCGTLNHQAAVAAWPQVALQPVWAISGVGVAAVDVPASLPATAPLDVITAQGRVPDPVVDVAPPSISHVAELGAAASKTAGVTLTLPVAPLTPPRPGDLVVVACARDDLANDPVTGDSLVDTAGNTWTRLAVAGNQGTDATAGNGVNLIVFWSVVTVGWPATATLTWTHPDVAARGMVAQHYTPSRGNTLSAYGTPVSAPSTGMNLANLTVAHPSPGGDLVVGAAAVANDVAMALTGDADTLGGSWSPPSARGGTGGDVAASNVFAFTQHKVITAPSMQVWSAALGASSSSGNALLTFHQMRTAGVRLVGIGAQAASQATAATVPLPPGVAAGDLLLILLGARPGDDQGVNDGVTIPGWSQHGPTCFRVTGAAADLSVQLWHRIAAPGEPPASVTVGSSLAGSASGWSAQIAAVRGVDPTTPFDVAPVLSDSAAANTWTPAGITTVTPGALVISTVATADDNGPDLAAPGPWRPVFSGPDFDTTTGGDHAVGLAGRPVATPGFAAAPTWTQTTVGPDAWAAITAALRPAP